MVTFLDLKNADFTVLRDHIGDWLRFSTQLQEKSDAFRTGVNDQTENAGWRGVSAGVADLELEQMVKRIALGSMEAQAIASALRQAPDEFQAAKNALLAALDDAAANQLTVTATDTGFDILEGAANPSTHPDDVNARYELVNSLVQRLNAAVKQANDADGRYASTLATLMPSEVALTNADAWKNATEDIQRAASLNGAGPIPPNMSPAQATTWWTSLTDAQRAEYVKAYPAEVGRMDGIPAVARDQANRNALTLRLSELGVLAAGPNLNQAYDSELKNLTKIQQTLAANANRPPEQALMLLKFDNKFLDGQVVMAVGNPDTAKNVVVHVPGVNTDVPGGLDGSIARTTKLQGAADRLTPGAPGDVAAIFWMDYDPPEMDPGKFEYTGMLGRDRSQEGAPRLDTFIDGLRTQHPDQHLTVSGHSYGSTVIGQAAKSGDGLAVDDIIVEGSPGMDVGRASDLQIDPDNVWALKADGDNVVPYGGQIFHGSDDPEPGKIQVSSIPSNQSFGGNVLVANEGDHGSYWNVNPDGSADDSLENAARVVMGTYTDPDPLKRPQVNTDPDPVLAAPAPGATNAPSY